MALSAPYKGKTGRGKNRAETSKRRSQSTKRGGAAGAVQVLESPGNYFEEPGEYSPRLFFYPQVMKMR